MTDKEKHNCDNVNCNHNDTKGLCCLFNPDNCKYRQLQKENAELKEQIEKMKSAIISERDEALRVEDIITYGVLNDVIDKWKIEENE